jgi:hypothetical protein
MVPGLGEFDRAVARLEVPHFDLTGAGTAAIGARPRPVGGCSGSRCGPLAKPTRQRAAGLMGAALDLGEAEGSGVAVEGGELLGDPIDERLEVGVMRGIGGRRAEHGGSSVTELSYPDRSADYQKTAGSPIDVRKIPAGRTIVFLHPVPRPVAC